MFYKVLLRDALNGEVGEDEDLLQNIFPDNKENVMYNF